MKQATGLDLVLSEISLLALRHLAPPAAGLCKTRKRKQRSSELDAVFSFSFCGEDEISHAERAFSLLLAGGALAHAMKLTAGGRGSFSFEGLYRSELLTAFK